MTIASSTSPTPRPDGAKESRLLASNPDQLLNLLPNPLRLSRWQGRFCSVRVRFPGCGSTRGHVFASVCASIALRRHPQPATPPRKPVGSARLRKKSCTRLGVSISVELVLQAVLRDGGRWIACALIVMPRSRSRSMESSTCAIISRWRQSARNLQQSVSQGSTCRGQCAR